MLTKEYLLQQYYVEKKSLRQIGEAHGLSRGSVAQWMDKYGLKRRNLSEALYCYYNQEERFKIRELSPYEQKLKIIGALLYWCEGTHKTHSTLAFTNTDLNMLLLWKKFLLRVCKLRPDKVRVRLYLHKDQDGEGLRRYWSQALDIPLSQFEGVSYTNKVSTKQGYKGTVKIRVHNVKLLQQVQSWIRDLISEMNGEG